MDFISERRLQLWCSPGCEHRGLSGSVAHNPLVCEIPDQLQISFVLHPDRGRCGRRTNVIPSSLGKRIAFNQLLSGALWVQALAVHPCGWWVCWEVSLERPREWCPAQHCLVPSHPSLSEFCHTMSLSPSDNSVQNLSGDSPEVKVSMLNSCGRESYLWPELCIFTANFLSPVHTSSPQTEYCVMVRVN